MNTINEAARIVKQSRRMVILTGAGMSVDSGVNDFRSRSGWWRQIDPRTVATVEALETDYDLFHEFYSARIRHLDNVKPHAGYEVLNRWTSIIQLIATQNVDGLHQQAGNEPVVELHGSIHQFRCHTCGQSAEKEHFLNKENCACGGRLRPGVVLFGEPLPQDAWSTALTAVERADAVMVIGTSLQVYPVNQLPALTDGKLILLNRDLTGREEDFDVVIQGRALDTLVSIDEMCK